VDKQQCFVASLSSSSSAYNLVHNITAIHERPSPRLRQHIHALLDRYSGLDKEHPLQKSTKRPSLNPTGTGSHSKTHKMSPTTRSRSTSPPPSKRRRTASLEGDLLTPPQQDEDPLINSTQTAPSYDSDDDNDNDMFSYAAHVLATEAAALASITTLYRSSAIAKQNLKAAVKTIMQTQHDRGKLIVTGVGKSAYIGQKLVATCKSMGVAASFMHACEAAHGDLGDIRDVSFCD
jgi:hypothetical protein